MYADGGNVTCSQFNSCSECISSDVVSCDWCSSDSKCINPSHSGSCPTEIVGTCSEAYYTIIFLVIMTVMLCMCCGLCYLRRTRQDDGLLRFFSPMLSQRARDYIFRNSLKDDGELEWMCVICGFDNKPRIKHCVMCGTSHEFSLAYKANKLEKKRRRQEKRDQQEKRRVILGNVVSDIGGSQQEGGSRENKEDDAVPVPVPSSGVVEAQAALKADRTVSLSEDAQISSISMSLKHFRTVPLTHEERSEAINYRRMNMLTMRQKSARRRKLWQRVLDPDSGEIVWQRVPVRKTIIGNNRFGYTPRPSVSSPGPSRRDDSMSLGQESRGGSEFTYRSTRIDSDEESASHTSLLNGQQKTSRNPIRALLAATRGADAMSPPRGARTPPRYKDSFDSSFFSNSPAYHSVLDEEAGELTWQRVEGGERVTGNRAGRGTHVPPSTAARENHALTERENRLASLQALLHDLYDGDRERPAHRDGEDGVDVDPESADLLQVAAYTFKDKQKWFYNLANKLALPIAQGGFIRININRANLLVDSFNAIMSIGTADLRKVFKFNFIGEMGIDAGGLEREWYSLICQEVFSPQHGFFVNCSNKDHNMNAYHINPLVHLVYVQHDSPGLVSGGINSSNFLLYYQFIGRVLGKALLSQQHINANLSLPLRKQIINVPISFSDLEFIDEELYSNLMYLKRNSNISSLGLDFSITYTYHKQHITCELLPNGSDVLVDDSNKYEYLQLRLQHRMLDSVKEPLRHLLCGFYEVIPPDIISVFDYMELDLLLCGVQDINLDDWLRHTEYQGEYNSRHPIIRWFWKAVESMSHEERVRLLQFTTGCARLPVQGFKALQSNDGRYRKFNIQPISKQDSIYPRAHTCFNKLDLPKYDSFQELEAHLSVVVNSMDAITGFTME